MVTLEIQKYIDASVLCWLATSSADNIPNVSPKEIFASYKKKAIIIANIASPQSVKNIRENDQACISFIDVLVQKGYQLKGKASIITSKQKGFVEMKSTLETLTQGHFPFASIVYFEIESAKAILAPKYILFPKTTEKEQVESALTAYKMTLKNE